MTTSELFYISGLILALFYCFGLAATLVLYKDDTSKVIKLIVYWTIIMLPGTLCLLFQGQLLRLMG